MKLSCIDAWICNDPKWSDMAEQASEMWSYIRAGDIILPASAEQLISVDQAPVQ